MLIPDKFGLIFYLSVKEGFRVLHSIVGLQICRQYHLKQDQHIVFCLLGSIWILNVEIKNGTKGILWGHCYLHMEINMVINYYLPKAYYHLK